MTDAERRAQVEKAIAEIIARCKYEEAPIDGAVIAILNDLRDPDGHPMVMVRDTDQTPPASRCSFNLHDGGVTRIVEVPDADEYRQRGFVKCIRPFEAKGKS